jgi:hypothetical protein
MEGFIKLWRDELSSGLLQNAEVWQLYSYCLLKATHQTHTLVVGRQTVKLETGQLVFGRKKAAEDLRSTEAKVRSALKTLKDFGAISVRSTTKFSVVTVCGWDLRQKKQTD